MLLNANSFSAIFLNLLKDDFSASADTERILKPQQSITDNTPRLLKKLRIVMKLPIGLSISTLRCRKPPTCGTSTSWSDCDKAEQPF